MRGNTSLLENTSELKYSMIWIANAMQDSTTIERMDRLYRCTLCDLVVLFLSEVNEHKTITGHDDFVITPLE
jgi:hypothetical protein